jgi:hypothetical protein
MRKLLAIALLACLPGIADAQTSSFFSQTTTTQQQVQTAPPVVVDVTPPTYFATGYTGCGVGANFAFRAGYGGYFGSAFRSRFSPFGVYGGFGGYGVSPFFVGGQRFSRESLIVGPRGGFIHTVRRF